MTEDELRDALDAALAALDPRYADSDLRASAVETVWQAMGNVLAPELGGGGGGGAPTNAQYITAATNGTLSAERVATDTTSVEWSFATAGQAKASVTAAYTADVLADAATASESYTDTELAAHVGAADPHPAYQKESEKGNANGYASLDGSTLVPVAQLPTATTSAKGVAELATSAETTAGLVVQASDTRLSDSRAPTGAAGGDLDGTYPNPQVRVARGLRETTGPTELAMGNVADGDGLIRSGSNIIGQPRYAIYTYDTVQSATHLTLPSWAKMVSISARSAGGGGGGGRGDPAAGTAHGGGGGGGTGSIGTWVGSTADIGFDLYITVGDGGTGAAGTNNSTTGGTGGNGGDTFIATTSAASGVTSTGSLLLFLDGGNGGGGGGTAGGAGGAAGVAATTSSGTPQHSGVWASRVGQAGGAGGAGASPGASGDVGGISLPMTAGRGGGGVNAAGGVVGAGGFTGAVASTHLTNQSGGASNAGGAGSDGSAGQVVSAPFITGGGTGGGAGGAGNGGNGGDGAAGSGGGGGGASIGGTGGTGGKGGLGHIRITVTG